MSEKDWKYVFTIQGDMENPGAVTLVGPFEDVAAADEYVEDRHSMTDAGETNIVVSLDDSDDVLAALKVERKKAKKAAKKAAKKEAKQATVKETIEAEDGKKDKGKKDKGKKKDKDAQTTEADASDVAAPSTEGAVPTADANGQPDTAVVEEGQTKTLEVAGAYTGSLADDKHKLIESWSRGMTKHPVVGPLNLSPGQRRVIAALKWCREVNKSNAHMPGTVQPPPPIVGIDANDRIVVQGLDGLQGLSGSPKQWAVLKNGDQADIKQPVRKLKTKVSESV